MRAFSQGALAAGWIAAAALFTSTAALSGPVLFVSIGQVDRSPLGWVEFCAEFARDCRPRGALRDVTLTPQAWNELVRVNKAVNTRIQPMTDLDHFGVVERWNYPDDGYGDCEDYVLLKRKMLLEMGWPSGALLITVVRDHKGDGHAVLTVKTDKGDLILDNQNEEIVQWSDANYRFVKRQSQTDPNVWVSLGDPRPGLATATSR
jgi:predicted transglutaminase-like cysteine proteinase